MSQPLASALHRAIARPPPPAAARPAESRPPTNASSPARGPPSRRPGAAPRRRGSTCCARPAPPHPEELEALGARSSAPSSVRHRRPGRDAVRTTATPTALLEKMQSESGSTGATPSRRFRCGHADREERLASPVAEPGTARNALLLLKQPQTHYALSEVRTWLSRRQPRRCAPPRRCARRCLPAGARPPADLVASGGYFPTAAWCGGCCSHSCSSRRHTRPRQRRSPSRARARLAGAGPRASASGPRPALLGGAATPRATVLQGLRALFYVPVLAAP